MRISRAVSSLLQAVEVRRLGGAGQRVVEGLHVGEVAELHCPPIPLPLVSFQSLHVVASVPAACGLGEPDQPP